MSNTNQARAPSIDGAQLRALLRCYFRLSTRGKFAQTMSQGRSRKPRGLLFIVVIYMFVGLMTGPMAFGRVDVFTYAAILHCMTFFVVGMAATSESGDVLFNANENDVLGHRPIHPRTLLLAKSLSLVGFTLLLAGALNLFPTFMGLAIREARPWFPLVHVLSIILLSVFCSAAVVCTYGFIIRLFDREKFDNIAAWSQVGMSILFVGGYQVLPRLIGQFKGLSITAFAPYLLPLPPAWFAALDALGCGAQASLSLWLLASVGLAVTGSLVYSAIGRLAPSYGEALAKLSETRARAAKPRRVRRAASRSQSPVLRWWLRDPIERATFRLAAAYMGRDREVKLRLYPSLSMFVIFPLMGLLDRRGGFSMLIPLMTVWMMGTLPVSALETLRMSSQYAASEIFMIAPLDSAAPLFHGVRKATIYYLLLPALCLSAVIIAFFVPQGRQALFLGLPGLIALPTLSLVPGCFSNYLPFSRPPIRGEQTARNMGVMFATMMGMGGLLVVSYTAWKFGFFWAFLAFETGCLIPLHWALAGHIKKRPMPRPEDGS